MAEIYNGEFVRNDTNEKSMGGTERLTLELSQRLDKELLQEFQIISSRIRSDLDPDKIRIFWAHDLPGDPESEFMKNRDEVEKFHKFVFVSNWQMQKYIDAYKIPWSKCIVIQNAIDPIEEHEKPSIEDGIRLIYTPTPHRGLNILVPVVDHLSKKYENIHLDVFSSFNLYGWGERDQQYKEVFDAIDAHPNMTNHGTVSNAEVRDALKKAHIFAYPSTWAETSCLCLMEAMSAGLVCVHSNFGALYETSANWTQMYQINEDPQKHAALFYSVLEGAIQHYNDESVRSKVLPMQTYSNVFYGWKQREIEWTVFLKAMLNHVKDRSIPKPMFRYKT